MELAQQIKPKKPVSILLLILLVICLCLSSTQITFFAIQSIGALPDGITLVILRGQGTKLFDSPDAMCERMQQGVSLLCRGLAIAQVAESGVVLLRLPYMDSVYLLSTGGERYEQ